LTVRMGIIKCVLS